MKSIKIPNELKKMYSIFEENGFEAFLVGGAVRDVILGKEASDWDVTTNATPEQVSSIFKKVIPTGIAHGTVTVHFMKKEIEVTTYRCDSGYSDGRHPDNVTFTTNLEEDLSRRDFTMNAIAASLKDGKIVDPFDGQQDIRKKIIRTVGKAYDRFMEDGLRPIRALRFSSQLGFEIESETFEAITNSDVQENIKSISMERFRDEFTKILSSPEPSVGLKAMEKTGILKMFIPELADCRGITQADARGFHEFDVLDHNIYACDGAPRENLTVRLAALFHDIGKKDARTVEKKAFDTSKPDELSEIIHFHGHEKISAALTRPILFRLKFPNALIDKVVHLIEQHMFFFEDFWSDAAVRRFIVRVKPEFIEDLFDLRYADIYGMHRIPVAATSPAATSLNHLRDRIAFVQAQKSAVSLKDMAVNGSDLISIGIPAGKKIGIILNELFQCILDDPNMNEREQLLNVAKKLAEKY
ncbi:CCA tRNA nucleotidyltransferase [Treponema zioleckii]|uniref:CCA tRNA nucleotidyltransferase n=1 Tax=Treponema zioleckii TaxID=331680 RepID=UPI00168B0164|nr:HD domain-containing protein [Treponema zioleckii]